MRRVLLFTIFSMPLLLSTFAHAEEYIEPGRYGVQLSVTEDTVFAGLAYKSDKLDFLLNFSGHSYAGENQPYSYPVNSKIGYRINLGDYNYFAVGARVNFVLFGKDYGNGAANQLAASNPPNATAVDLFGMGRYGSYISLQRHFPHSHIYLELNMMPFAYQLNILNVGGARQVNHDWRYFESGEVGIAYLFGTSGDDLKH